MQFENDIVINKPAGVVFDYLLDLERLPDWNYAIVRTSQITPGNPTVGTEYHQERSLPHPMTEELEITGVKANELVEVSGGFGPFPFGVSRYEIQSLSPTSTLVRNHVQLKAEGALRLIAPISTLKIKTAVAQNLQVLKANVEDLI